MQKVFDHAEPECPPGYYQIRVTLTRPAGEDIAVVAPNEPDSAELNQLLAKHAVALVAQLVKELQPAYDDGVAGDFQVTAMFIRGD